MFSNFLYFLIALVIYTAAELFDRPKNMDPAQAYQGLYYSLVSGLAFALVCHTWFKMLGRKHHQRFSMDHSINGAISKLSILALVLFSANIYLFRLPLLLEGIPLFQWVPTLGTALFLALFLLYLVIVWNFAYGVQKHYFSGELTKRSFVFSNISFSLPALLPWFCLSLFADLVQFLPHEPVRDFLNSTAGEITYIVFFLTVIAIFGPVLIQKMWRCNSLEPGYYRARIEATCKQAGLKYADILKWELFGGTMITAGVMGLVARFRYILVTPALLNSLDDSEIEAVILHEIGHVQRFHMVFYLLFFVGFIACNFVFFEPILLLLYIAGPLYQGFAFLGIDKADAYPLLICLFLIGFFVVYFRVVFGFFMRNFERQADIHVYGFQQDASPLISTFYKIASLSRQSIDRPNWHHFSIGQRIRFLEQCGENPGLIDHHHAWVKKMMMGYFLLILVLFAAGYSMNYGAAKQGFGNFIAGQILFQQLEVDPDNSDLYVFVGDYYYSDKVYDKAIHAYENVLRIDNRNVHALNNLAWLLATCPEEGFRNVSRALELASAAVALQREPFILDTYAEALALNNRIDQAIEVAKEALALARDKKSYYKDQVKRFETQGKGL